MVHIEYKQACKHPTKITRSDKYPMSLSTALNNLPRGQPRVPLCEAVRQKNKLDANWSGWLACGRDRQPSDSQTERNCCVHVSLHVDYMAGLAIEARILTRTLLDL